MKQRYKKIILTLLWLLAALPIAADGKFVLVIDAGHGGHDPGCIGKISKEKELTLKYALAFGQLVENNCKDVKVVYTRKTDRYWELWQRAEMANKNKADLFISVHINALPGGRIAHGIQTYALGRGNNTGKKGIMENLEVAKRENSVILLEKNYKQTYQGFDPNSPESNIMFEFIQDKNMERSVEVAKYMQREMCAATGRSDMGTHQDNLAVLRLTSMPGCLLELGFISTPDEEQYLNSAEALKKYAQGMYRAFLKYKNKYGNNSVQRISREENNKRVEELRDLGMGDFGPKNDQEAQSLRENRGDGAPSPMPEPPTTAPQDAPMPPPPPQQNALQSTVESIDAQAEPIFKLQILASNRPVKKGDFQLKGEEMAEEFEENGWYKYTIGASANYNEIYRLRKDKLEKFPQAFIIAFKEGQKMDVNQAIREYKQNKQKR